MRQTRRLAIDVDDVGERKCGGCQMAHPVGDGTTMCVEFGTTLDVTRKGRELRCLACLEAEGKSLAENAPCLDCCGGGTHGATQ